MLVGDFIWSAHRETGETVGPGSKPREVLVDIHRGEIVGPVVPTGLARNRIGAEITSRGHVVDGPSHRAVAERWIAEGVVLMVAGACLGLRHGRNQGIQGIGRVVLVLRQCMGQGIGLCHGERAGFYLNKSTGLRG